MYVNGLNAQIKAKEVTRASKTDKKDAVFKKSDIPMVTDVMDITTKVRTNELQYALERAYVKTQSDIIFKYLNLLKIHIISQEIDTELMMDLKEKLLKNKQKFLHQDLEELFNEVIMRLEIEIAKLDHLKIVQRV